MVDGELWRSIVEREQAPVDGKKLADLNHFKKIKILIKIRKKLIHHNTLSRIFNY